MQLLKAVMILLKDNRALPCKGPCTQPDLRVFMELLKAVMILLKGYYTPALGHMSVE